MNLSNGWIGSWSPGIGDPTPVGWLTVGFYGLAVWLSYQVVRREYNLHESLDNDEKWLWWAFVFGLAFLGVNKQLDLQSAVTEMARMLAVYGGWYNDRREAQVWFVGVVALISVVILLVMFFITKGKIRSTKLTVFGFVFLLSFIVIRAASFHHIDIFIKNSYFGIQVNWLLEIGGLIVICYGAFLRSRK